MKDEIDVSGCTKVGEVKAILGDWLNYYNTERYQWQLAKLSPDEYLLYVYYYRNVSVKWDYKL